MESTNEIQKAKNDIVVFSPSLNAYYQSDNHWVSNKQLAARYHSEYSYDLEFLSLDATH